MSKPGTDELPDLDLSLLAQVTPDTIAPDAAPELPPNETPDHTESPRPGRSAAGRPRSAQTRAQRQGRRGAAGTQHSPDETGQGSADHIIAYRPGILVKPLSELYTSVGTLVLPFNQPVGTAFIQNAQACAEALDSAARQDPRIRKMLLALVATSVWGQLVAAHMPILMAMAVTMVPSVRDSVANITRPPGKPPDEESETVNPYSRDNGRMPRL